jgi:beta-galactosidase
MLHGGDYNPEQWLHRPDILDEDVRLMRLAGCNAMSVGIFSWTAMEPREGCYEFGWLDRVMDKLAAAGVHVVLATPSGARPAWMAEKYPQVQRVSREGRRNLPGSRHDHCLTSPIYRDKCLQINTQLAQRYGRHPAVIAWHVSNEYGGECCCDLCMESFRKWAARKFNGDIDALNKAGWLAFWNRSYGSFEQIENGWYTLPMQWRRFTTDQTIDFYLQEIAPLKRIAPDLPATTNMMGFHPTLNYVELARHLDFVCWDSYPHWHGPAGDVDTACYVGLCHDFHRALKGGRPWALMESQPQIAKGKGVLPLKRPGMHVLTSLQAIAHGSDTVQYFQWRKGRGGEEKYHGAVVDHAGHENTRGFREVADLGAALAKLDDVVGTTTHADAAVICDWESRWAIEPEGYLGDPMHQYITTIHRHYAPLWARGVSVDVLDETGDFGKYKLVVAPLLYMLRAGIDGKLARFVEAGGTLVCTYGTGMVDEDNLAILGGWPGGELRRLLGVWNEETDGLYPDQRNSLKVAPDNGLGLRPAYDVHEVAAMIHAEGARVLATYGSDFYAGSPALTVNTFGKGRAYYIAARTGDDFLNDFYGALARQLGLRSALAAAPPAGVSTTVRTDGVSDFVFLMNFNASPARVDLGPDAMTDVLTGQPAGQAVELPARGWRILRRRSRNQ